MSQPTCPDFAKNLTTKCSGCEILSDGNAGCTHCLPGYFIDKTTHGCCPDNCQTCSPNPLVATCTGCKPGYILTSDGYGCLACPSNCDQCVQDGPSSKRCAKCTKGYYPFDGGKSCSVSCGCGDNVAKYGGFLPACLGGPSVHTSLHPMGTQCYSYDSSNPYVYYIPNGGGRTQLRPFTTALKECVAGASEQNSCYFRNFSALLDAEGYN